MTISDLQNLLKRFKQYVKSQINSNHYLLSLPSRIPLYITITYYAFPLRITITYYSTYCALPLHIAVHIAHYHYILHYILQYILRITITYCNTYFHSHYALPLHFAVHITHYHYTLRITIT